MLLVLGIGTHRFVALPAMMLSDLCGRANVIRVALLHYAQTLLQFLQQPASYIDHEVLFAQLEVALIEELLTFEFALLAASAQLEVAQTQATHFCT